YVGSYIYWLVELAIMAGIALGVTASHAARPFCALCGRWKEAKQLGVIKLAGPTGLELFRSGELGRQIQGRPGPTAGTIATCPVRAAESTVEVKLEEVWQNKRGEVMRKNLGMLTYPGEALQTLEKIFQPVPAPAPRNPPAVPPGQASQEGGSSS